MPPKLISHWNDPDLPAPASPYCHAVMDDRYAFLAGRVAVDVPGGAKVLGDIAAETELVLRSIRDTLARLELGMDRVVRVDVLLTDLNDWAAMDAVYRGFFPANAYPARTCSGSSGLYGGCRVEITCMARLPDGAGGSSPDFSPG